MSESVFCTQCGHPNPNDALFCLKCGQAIFKTEDLLPVSAPESPLVSLGAGAIPEFISLTCPHCGGALKVSADVRRLTCLNCGSTHDVIREKGGAILRPLFEQIDQINAQLSAENASRRAAATSTQSVHQQSAASIADLERTRARETAYQEVLVLEQRIRENEAVINETGTSGKDLRNGLIGLLLAFGIGLIGEIVLRNQSYLPYDEGPVMMVIAVVFGVLWFLWCVMMSVSKNSRKGSRRTQENRKMQARVDALRKSLQ